MADDVPMTKEEVERLRGWAEGRELLHLTPSQVRRLLAGLDAERARADRAEAWIKDRRTLLLRRLDAAASEVETLSAERDRLAARVAELEARPPTAGKV